MEKIYRKRCLTLGLAIAVFVLIIAFLIFCVHIVPTGYTGVMISFGQVREAPVQNGRVVVTAPLVSTVAKVNNKQQDTMIEAQIWGEASDRTPVYASDVTVTYQIAPERSVWIYANVTGYTKNLVGSEIVASAVKSAMVELAPDEVTVRSRIEPLVKEKLQASLDEKYGKGTVTVSKVVINNMDFDAKYNEAIAAKSIAQQTYERQQIENETAISKAAADKTVAVTKAEADAETTRIEAEAQAEANRLLSESLTDALMEYRKVEKWDGALPKVSGAGTIVDIGEISEG